MKFLESIVRAFDEDEIERLSAALQQRNVVMIDAFRCETHGLHILSPDTERERIENACADVGVEVTFNTSPVLIPVS